MDEIEKNIEILWNYMQMNHKLKRADCIIGLGSPETKIAILCSDLLKNGYSDKIIFSGGLGKKTQHMWNETEADKFAEIAINEGIDKNKIYIENQSTNTGDNFRLSKRLIETKGLKIQSIIIVCKPYVEKRVYAAFKKIMPEYEGIVYSEATTFKQYRKSRKDDDWIHDLVGCVQRMDLFYKKGWQIKVDIPEEVWQAYNYLVNNGYTKYVLKGIDDPGECQNAKNALSSILNKNGKNGLN